MVFGLARVRINGVRITEGLLYLVTKKELDTDKLTDINKSANPKSNLKKAHTIY